MLWVSVDERAFADGDAPQMVRGISWLVWHVPPSHAGSCIWGPVTIVDSQRLGIALSRLLFSAKGPIDIVNDLSAVGPTDFPSEVFAHNFGLAEGLLPRANEVLRRQVFVVPHGAAGAPWFGVNVALDVSFQWRCFTERPPAWEFVELPSSAIEAVEELVLSVRSEGASVERALSVLDADPHAGLGAVAARLGLSPRSLQRNFQVSGLSFEALRQQARLLHAQRLIADPSIKIESIGEACGFASSAHFFRWFKRATGETPGRMRKLLVPAPG